MKKVSVPSDQVLASTLGAAHPVWNQIIESLEARHGVLEQEWRPSKQPFGAMCLLKQKDRTLVYLTPDQGRLMVALVLGERAAGLALSSEIPDYIKALIQDARPYAEGRGIRFPVEAEADVPVVLELVAFKTRR